MNKNMDLMVLGAGPAGLAAAVEARRCGLEVALLDDQPAPGGQLYKGLHTKAAQGLHDEKELSEGLALLRAFEECGAEYLSSATVYGLEPGSPGLVHYVREGEAHTLSASVVVAAQGAMERPVPFPGWTLPGVLGAGAADILLKSAGTFSETGAPVVLAGNGPLLLSLACHLVERDIPIAAWLDTGDVWSRIRALPLMPLALLGLPYLAKGLGMARRILKKRVPIVRGVTQIRAEGREHVERVRYVVKSEEHEIETSTLIRHEGVIPRTHLPSSLNLPLRWDALSRSWHPVCGENGQTGLFGFLMAGDGSFVHGGDASALKGTLAGIEAARLLKVIGDDEARFRSAGARRRLKRLKVARAFLQPLFAPAAKIFDVPGETIVCRCERVTAGDIRRAVDEGFTNIDDIKRVTRCGMGPCQGRMCGQALAELAAAACGKSPRDMGTLRVRQPLRPVTLEQYCALHARQD